MTHSLAAAAPANIRGYFSFPRDAGAITALDGLRAAAILLVLARHAITPFREPGTPFFPVFGWDAATPLVNGWIGVDLFFVLSGFLIARGLIRRFDATGEASLRRYFARRALRILPAYYAVLFIASAGLVPFFAVAPDMLGLRVVYHMLFLQDYLPSNIVIAFWSLGVEEKFYIAAPFVLVPLLRLKRRRLQYALLAGLILTPLAFRLNVAAGGTVIADYETFFRTLRSPFHRGFDGLAVGVLAALLWRDRKRLRWLRAPLLDLIDPFDRTLLQLVLALGFGAMLLGAVAGGGPQGLMGTDSLNPAAKLSYSLYLVHMTVIPASILLAKGVYPEGASDSALLFVVFIPAYVILTLLGSLLLHFGIEKPFLQLRRL
ncbi:MAG: acyltransferase family protein [Alphaproteobacteria bacterium]